MRGVVLVDFDGDGLGGVRIELGLLPSDEALRFVGFGGQREVDLGDFGSGDGPGVGEREGYLEVGLGR